MQVRCHLLDGSLVVRECRQFCEAVGIDYEQEFAENQRFITLSILESRVHHLPDLTSQNSIVYLSPQSKTISNNFPYLPSLLPYYYNSPTSLQNKAYLDRQLRTIMKDEQNSMPHKLRVELSEVDEIIVKQLCDTLGELRWMIPKQRYEVFAEIYFDVCQWYETKYGSSCFSEQLQQFAHRGYETKFEQQLSLLGFDYKSKLGNYFDNLLTNLELMTNFSLSVNQDKYIYKKEDRTVLFSVNPAVMYLMRSYKYFVRRRGRGRCAVGEWGLDRKYGQEDGSRVEGEEELKGELKQEWEKKEVEEELEVRVAQMDREEVLGSCEIKEFTTEISDAVLISLVEQVGLKPQYDILAYYIGKIYNYLNSKSTHHKEWQILQHPSGKIYWYNKPNQLLLCIYPYLFQLCLQLSSKTLLDLPSLPPRPQLLSKLITKIPSIQQIVSRVDGEKIAAEYMLGGKSVAQIVKDRLTNQDSSENISGWEETEMISSLVFCQEYTHQNRRTAEVLLTIAGNQRFEDVVELEGIVGQLRNLKEVDKGKEKETTNKKKNDKSKKISKKEKVQNDFLRLTKKIDKLAEVIIENPPAPKQQLKDPPPSPINIPKPTTPLPVYRNKTEHSQKKSDRIKSQVDGWPEEPSLDTSAIQAIQKREPTIVDEPSIIRFEPQHKEQPSIIQQKNTQDHSISITQTQQKLNITESTLNTTVLPRHDNSHIASISQQIINQDIQIQQQKQRPSAILPIVPSSSIDLSAYKSVFHQSHRHHPNPSNPPSNSLLSQTLRSIIKPTLDNLNYQPYPRPTLVSWIKKQQQFLSKVLDFHQRKQYFSEHRQQQLLCNLIQQLYYMLRKEFNGVEWKNQELPQRIRDSSSVVMVNRSRSLKTMKRLKDMNVERAVDIILDRKLRGNSKYFIKLPSPGDLFPESLKKEGSISPDKKSSLASSNNFFDCI